MADLYASIASIDVSIQENLGDILELRGADTQQTEMRESYLSLLELPGGAQALEVGCGTGVVSRYLASLDRVASVIGIDPSSVFVDKARRLSQGLSGIAFETGDARSLPFDEACFDLVVFHTSLCHIPTPETALEEAKRVLRPGGLLAIFDGDYASATVALDEHDPLQSAVEAMVGGFVENKWLIRQMPRVMAKLGFILKDFRSYGYTAVTDASYMLTLIDRGIELMLASGTLGPDQGEALRLEARRRVKCGEFFGQISYLSALVQKAL